MTGNEIVSKVRQYRGKVQMGVIFPNDVNYMYVEKQDIIRQFKEIGDNESGMEFHVNENGDAFIDTDF